MNISFNTFRISPEHDISKLVEKIDKHELGSLIQLQNVPKAKSSLFEKSKHYKLMRLFDEKKGTYLITLIRNDHFETVRKSFKGSSTKDSFYLQISENQSKKIITVFNGKMHPKSADAVERVKLLLTEIKDADTVVGSFGIEAPIEAECMRRMDGVGFSEDPIWPIFAKNLTIDKIHYIIPEKPPEPDPKPKSEKKEPAAPAPVPPAPVSKPAEGKEKEPEKSRWSFLLDIVKASFRFLYNLFKLFI